MYSTQTVRSGHSPFDCLDEWKSKTLALLTEIFILHCHGPYRPTRLSVVRLLSRVFSLILTAPLRPRHSVSHCCLMVFSFSNQLIEFTQLRTHSGTLTEALLGTSILSPPPIVSQCHRLNPGEHSPTPLFLTVDVTDENWARSLTSWPQWPFQLRLKMLITLHTNLQPGLRNSSEKKYFWNCFVAYILSILIWCSRWSCHNHDSCRRRGNAACHPSIRIVPLPI